MQNTLLINQNKIQLGQFYDDATIYQFFSREEEETKLLEKTIYTNPFKSVNFFSGILPYNFDLSNSRVTDEAL